MQKAGDCIDLQSYSRLRACRRLPASLTETRQETCSVPFDCSAHLQDEQEKKVRVCYFLELLKQVDGQKGEDVVLGGHDAVTLEEDERDMWFRRF